MWVGRPVRSQSEGTRALGASVSMQSTAGPLPGAEGEHGIELIYLMTERLISPEPWLESMLDEGSDRVVCARLMHVDPQAPVPPSSLSPPPTPIRLLCFPRPFSKDQKQGLRRKKKENLAIERDIEFTILGSTPVIIFVIHIWLNMLNKNKQCWGNVNKERIVIVMSCVWRGAW